MESTWVIQAPNGAIQNKAHPKYRPVGCLTGMKEIVGKVDRRVKEIHCRMEGSKPRVFEDLLYVVIDKWGSKCGMVERQHPNGAHYRETQIFMFHEPPLPAWG